MICTISIVSNNLKPHFGLNVRSFVSGLPDWLRLLELAVTHSVTIIEAWFRLCKALGIEDDNDDVHWTFLLDFDM
jgi:hypothetical protein